MAPGSLNQQKTFYNVPTYVHNFTLTSQGLLPLGGTGGTAGSGASWGSLFLSAH